MAVTKTFQGVRVVSDGSGRGTQLFDEDGSEISLKCARCVTWRCDAKEAVVTVEFYGAKQPVTLPAVSMDEEAAL